jgi:large subunit ribosomal protein L10
MTRADKNLLIEELTQVLAQRDVVYLADASGMDSLQTTNFRRECYSKGITVRVVKNTLLRKAMENVEEKDFSELYGTLKGQTVLMTAEVGNLPAKVIKELRKKSEKPLLKAAYVEAACFIGDNQIDALSSIKSKEEVIADVVALLQSPAKNVLGALQSGGHTISGLVKALEERGA